MTASHILAIEISNPSSGPRGVITPQNAGPPTPAGPGVALGRLQAGGGVEPLGIELLHEGSRHDDDLMPAIDRLCRAHAVRPRDLSAIAVSIGPGGYTSLRIAVATAKMIAEATGASVIPVPSAAVAAWLIPLAPPTLICLASKGDSAHATLATSARTADLPSSKPLGLTSADDLTRLRPALVVADTFLPDPMRAAAQSMGATITEPIFSARSVLEIAANLPPIDPLALAPIYSRQAEAVTQWQKRKLDHPPRTSGPNPA